MAKRRISYHFIEATIHRLGYAMDGQGETPDERGDFMTGHVTYTIEFDGKRSPILSSDVKMPAGGDYFKDQLEVMAPVMYQGIFDHATFRMAADRYMRLVVGPPGSGAFIILEDVNNAYFEEVGRDLNWSASYDIDR